jgi:DNA-binding transcriptional LysR family regulator
MYSYSLNSLVVFYEVVQLKSFSKAAEVLCLTQPGVSNHISQLEVQTGRSLLKREKGTIELTPEGKVIFKYAERIVKITEELEKRIKSMDEEVKPHLNVGTTTIYSRAIMPELLGSFQKAFPQVMIKLDTGSSEEMENTLVSGHNDIVIVANPKISKKLHVIPFLKEELVLITSKDHALSNKESVSLREIKDYPLIIREEGSATRKVVLSALKSMRIAPSVLIEVKSTEFIKEWVSKGKGISVLVKRSILEDEKRRLKMIPLAPSLLLEISILFLKSMKYNIWIQKFTDYMRDPACNPFLQR